MCWMTTVTLTTPFDLQDEMSALSVTVVTFASDQGDRGFRMTRRSSKPSTGGPAAGWPPFGARVHDAHHTQIVDARHDHRDVTSVIHHQVLNG